MLNVPAVCVLKGVPIITTGSLKSRENGNPGMPIFTGCVYFHDNGLSGLIPCCNGQLECEYENAYSGSELARTQVTWLGPNLSLKESRYVQTSS